MDMAMTRKIARNVRMIAETDKAKNAIENVASLKEAGKEKQKGAVATL